MFANIYSAAMQSQTMFWVLAAVLISVTWVLRMIYEQLRDMYVDWREDRRAAHDEDQYDYEDERPAPRTKADKEATRILAGLYPDRYNDELTITNEQYFEQGQRTLSDRWRDFVEESRPRSPEVVSEVSYQRTVAMVRERPAIEALVNRSWPQWTEDEKRTVGRHRAENQEKQPYQDWALNALLTPTGAFTALDRRELISA